MRSLLLDTTLRGGLILLVASVAACGDDSSPSGGKTPDSTVPQVDAAPSTSPDTGVELDSETPPPPDAAPTTAPDADVVDAELPPPDAPVTAAPDVAVPDMAVMVDAAPVDAFVPPVADAGMACVPPANVGDEDGCGDFSNCVDELCQLDLQPRVFRMTAAETLEPATAQAQLDLALQLALATGSINLILEPGGYTDLGYRFNLGNGRLIDDANPELGYVFNHNLPIQDIRGEWRVQQDGTTRFEQVDLGTFTIWAPARTIVVDGQRETCWTDIRATVRVRVEPTLGENGEVVVQAAAEGFMTVADAERIVFPLGGNDIALSDYLDEEPVVDADGDGVAAEYNFHIAIEATEITLSDNNPARDPNAVPFEPAECDQN